MKKQSIIQGYLVATALLTVQLLPAQISVGFRGGYLLTNYEKSPLEQDEPAPTLIGGFQAAIPIEIGLTKRFSIQPELMLGSHGGKQEDKNTSTQLGITTTSSYKFTYQILALEIPVLAKLNFGSEDFKFHVFAGPSIGLGVGGTLKQHSYLHSEAGGVVFIDETLDAEYKAKFLQEGYSTTALGDKEFAVAQANFNLHAGLGLSFDLGGPLLVCDARFIAGLSDLHPKAENQSANYVYKSQRIGLSFGLMFPM